jgi:ABC-type iron transport system FetAB ATPase subunit
MLSARNVHHAYAGRTVLSLEAFDLEAGSVTALVGPNGAGKSTLLRILAVLERPDAGTLSLDGRPLVSAADRRWARRHVTLVEQHPYLFGGTVRHNLHYALSLQGIRGPEAARRSPAARRTSRRGRQGHPRAPISDLGGRAGVPVKSPRRTCSAPWCLRARARRPSGSAPSTSK